MHQKLCLWRDDTRHVPIEHLGPTGGARLVTVDARRRQWLRLACDGWRSSLVPEPSVPHGVACCGDGEEVPADGVPGPSCGSSTVLPIPSERTSWWFQSAGGGNGNRTLEPQRRVRRESFLLCQHVRKRMTNHGAIYEMDGWMDSPYHTTLAPCSSLTV